LLNVYCNEFEMSTVWRINIRYLRQNMPILHLCTKS